MRVKLWSGCSHSELVFETNTHCFLSKTGKTGDTHFYLYFNFFPRGRGMIPYTFPNPFLGKQIIKCVRKFYNKN